MLITLWAILLGFSFLILVLGHFTNLMMSDIFILIGYFLLFMLGGIMMFNGVINYSGLTQTINYTYEVDEYNTSIISQQTITETKTTSSYETGTGIISYVDNARMIGLFILLIGAFGFITFWIDNRKYKQLKHEEFEEVEYED